MKITLRRLRQLISEAMMKQITLDDVKKLYPDAYYDLLHGEWEDYSGRLINTRRRLEAYLAESGSTFYINDAGQLIWNNDYESVTWVDGDWQ